MTLYYVCIEPIETRYTKHWYDLVFDQLDRSIKTEVVRVEGEILTDVLTPGAFFNFASTINYKNTQINRIAEMFQRNEINDGDVFFVADAWNASAHQIRYLADMHHKTIKMAGIWHAGAYDPNDFLGRQMKNKTWAHALESSMAALYDVNFFSTQYHLDLFSKSISVDQSTVMVCGFPMEYMVKMFNYDIDLPREDLIVFPHRKSIEKNVGIFERLQEFLPDYKFVVCQDVCSDKTSYHALLRRAKIVFSANLQETLGIGTFEGMMSGCIPVVPDRLSYCEMYQSAYRYPSSWTEGDVAFDELSMFIKDRVERYDEMKYQLTADTSKVYNRFFDGTVMYQKLNELIDD